MFTFLTNPLEVKKAKEEGTKVENKTRGMYFLPVCSFTLYIIVL